MREHCPQTPGNSGRLRTASEDAIPCSTLCSVGCAARAAVQILVEALCIERARTLGIERAGLACLRNPRLPQRVKIHRSTDETPTADLPPRADVLDNTAIR